jgi:predicted acyltransferase
MNKITSLDGKIKTWKERFRRKRSANKTAASEAGGGASSRLLSVDALRGFVMLCIAGGDKVLTSLDKVFHSDFTQGICVQFKHPKWEGFRFYDIIMPLFMFIVGTALTFSFQKRMKLQGKKRFYGHVLKRVVILFVLGMIYAGHLLDLDWEGLKPFSNTLQAIAVGYLGASLIMLLKPSRQVAVTVLLLGAYWALLKFVPVPEVGAGVLTPEGNFAGYMDTLLLGSHRDGTEYSWMLSSLVFVVTVMQGVFAGHILRSSRSPYGKAFWLALCGVGCLAAGYVWSLDTPIIKKIWTSSFTLVSGGYCFLLMALFYVVIDVLQFRRWAHFLVVIGANAILVYMVFAYNRFINLSQLAGKLVYGLDQWLGPWKHFSRAVVAVLLLYLLMNYLYRKKTFIKI